MVLFLVVAVVAATAWAMTALSSEALDRDALEVSIARRLADLNRVTQDLEVADHSSCEPHDISINRGPFGWASLPGALGSA